ncbi:MAG: 4Fe-4S binding protein [Candidatus Thorarchaeota archaeon]
MVLAPPFVELLKVWNSPFAKFKWGCPPTRRRTCILVQGQVIPMIWKVNENCTACGTCADVCPVDPTLYVINDKAVYQEARADECTECYACVDSCPEGAIEE